MSQVVEVQQDEEGNQFIEFPPQMLEQVGWKEGDTISWTQGENGSWILSKKE